MEKRSENKIFSLNVVNTVIAILNIIGLVIVYFTIRLPERNRLDRALSLEIFKAYLASTDTPNVDLWQRKLDLMEAFDNGENPKLNKFINSQREVIKVVRKSATDLHIASKEISNTKKERDAAIAELEVVKSKYSKLSKEGSQDAKILVNTKNELNKKITDLDSKIKNASDKVKVYKENLTAHGFSNAVVNISGVGAKTSNTNTNVMLYDDGTPILYDNGESVTIGGEPATLDGQPVRFGTKPSVSTPSQKK
ncbi:hypothetical protein [Geomonas diazotrophica]|uniref:hypothetical protein n=1 Tax=Geomonas diazotrophica TaxID=2843197 RepID=UPI001F21D068|nr:hypothetical protein [Geomonas diazotrophica]